MNNPFPIVPSPHLRILKVPSKCRGFEEEECFATPTHAIVMAEPHEEDATAVTLSYVCTHHARLWETYYMKRAEA